MQFNFARQSWLGAKRLAWSQGFTDDQQNKHRKTKKHTNSALVIHRPPLIGFHVYESQITDSIVVHEASHPRK